MKSLTLMQYLLFFSGWLAWTVDAIGMSAWRALDGRGLTQRVTDFFSVSLSNTRLTTYFDKPLGTITTSITLTLLFRPLGAIIFGLLGDRYGRKYPLIADLLICGVLSLGTAYAKTFPQFLGLRSAFGVSMGGIWGLSAATALENMPVEARGFFSGILQQGYAVGYLLAAVLNLTEVAKHGNWRVLFYFAAAVSAFAVSLAALASRCSPMLVNRPFLISCFPLSQAFIRLLLPESQAFIDRRNAEKASGTVVSSREKSRIFLKEAGRAVKLHWIRCIFAICLMTVRTLKLHV
jgi:SHS family lactate transporter-like MFS transporter